MEKNNFIRRFLILFLGIYLFALGLTFIIYCGLGMDSWNVFHDGLANLLGIKLGYASVLVSLMMMGVAMVFGEPLGIGTIINGVFVGIFVQWHIDSGVFEVQRTLPMGLLYLFIGMVTIGFASYLYMKQGFGSGPRDSFNLALSKKMGIKTGHAKSLVEVFAVILGIILGGDFGVATVLGAIFTGIIIQIVFDLMKFEPKDVKHQSFRETIIELSKR